MSENTIHGFTGTSWNIPQEVGQQTETTASNSATNGTSGHSGSAHPTLSEALAEYVESYFSTQLPMARPMAAFGSGIGIGLPSDRTPTVGTLLETGRTDAIARRIINEIVDPLLDVLDYTSPLTQSNIKALTRRGQEIEGEIDGLSEEAKGRLPEVFRRLFTDNRTSRSMQNFCPTVRRLLVCERIFHCYAQIPRCAQNVLQRVMEDYLTEASAQSADTHQTYQTPAGVNPSSAPIQLSGNGSSPYHMATAFNQIPYG